MPWEKSSAELVDLFQLIRPSGPGIQHKLMFGYPCAILNGNLFAGLFRQSMTFRLSSSDRAAFLDQPGSADFEPMPGRKMTGFVMFRDPFSVGESVLSDWMKCALQFAAGLPPKEKAASKKKAIVKAPSVTKKAAKK